MIKTGSVKDFSDKCKGWIAGSFVDEPDFLHTDDFEVKWSKLLKGTKVFECGILCSYEET